MTGLFSGISNISTSLIGGKGGAASPFKRVLGSFPSTSGLGNAIGTIAGGKIKQGLLGLGAKNLPNIFKDKYFGPLANQIWGNLLYSEGDGIAAMESRRDPLLNIDWVVNMPLDTGINVHVEEINLSATGIDFTPFQRAGRTINMASMRSTAAVSLVFYTDNVLTCVNYLETWKSLVANPDGTFNHPAEYKQTIMVNLVDSSGNYVGSFFCANCFPSGPYQYGASSGNAERIRITQEFSCEAVVFVPQGSSSGIIDSIFG